MKYKRWTKEEHDMIIECWKENMPIKKIAEILDVSPEKMTGKIKTMREQGYDLPERKRKGVEITEEQALAYVREFETEKNYLDHRATLPPINVIRRMFGSWTKARIAAGLGASKSTLKEDEPTSVYVLYFESEDFYKVGITQNNLKRRFGAYPDYEVLYEKVLPLKDAKCLEKQLLADVVRHFEKYVPEDPVFTGGAGKHGGGSTECFKGAY